MRTHSIPRQARDDEQSRTILTLAIIALLAGTAAEAKYSGGSGEPNNPYQIDDTNDLLALAADTNDYGKCFILTADINLQGQTFTTAIIAADTSSDDAFQGTAFTGRFDGASHKIINFTSYYGGSNHFLGLFGYINSGSVKNLGLENFSVGGWVFVGGLVGYNAGTITNCYSTGEFVSVSFSECVGGLVGYNSGTISNCYSTGTVSGISDIGGLVGVNNGSISNCYSTGAVSGVWGVGGLVSSGDPNLVTTSFWDKDASGQTTSAGGDGKTTAEMKTLSTFTSAPANWDFTTIWAICEGTNYPRFLWQIPAADWVCPNGINMEDLGYFVERWMESDCTPANNYCGGTDINASGVVDMRDFALFALHWLEGTGP